MARAGLAFYGRGWSIGVRLSKGCYASSVLQRIALVLVLGLLGCGGKAVIDGTPGAGGAGGGTSTSSLAGMVANGPARPVDARE